MLDHFCTGTKKRVTLQYRTVPYRVRGVLPFVRCVKHGKKSIPGTTARDSNDATGSISTLCSRNMLEVFMLYDDAIEVLTL